jgi:heterodisulfide reductase subunit D
MMAEFHIPTMAELISEGKSPEILFWVGCAGSFDSRSQKVSKAFCRILHELNISYAILGNEEACTGDPARRAGNEFLFQMLALQNIQTLDAYGIRKIIATCPHCFNVLKNEYPELGGKYEVVHHTQFLSQLMAEGKLKVKGGGVFNGQRITYHDSCYLGRANDVYEAPRELLEALDADLVEMQRNKKNGLCCGAGGAQMWKEDEPGDKRINIERSEEALATGASVVAVNCPFCMTMMSDGIKAFDKQEEVMVYDLSEMIIKQNEWTD